MMATFNTRGDQPDHAVRAAGAALALQRELTRLADDHPGWPRLRVGVNSGEAVVRELGGTASSPTRSSATPSTPARGSKARRRSAAC